MGSRRRVNLFASPVSLARGAACWLGVLKASGEFEAGEGCFPGDFAALAEGTRRSHSQEDKQHSRIFQDKVLTHLWRYTSSASTAGRHHCCSLGTLSSCGAHRSPDGAGRSVGHGNQHAARLVRLPRRRPRECWAEESPRAPPHDGPPRPRKLQPADCVAPSAVTPTQESRAPGGGTSGSPSGIDASAPAPPAFSGARPPASTLGASSTLAAGRGTIETGFSWGPSRPTGRIPIRRRGATPPCLSSSTRYSPPATCQLARGRPSRPRALFFAPRAEALTPEASCDPGRRTGPTSAGNGAGEGRRSVGGTPSSPWAQSRQDPSASSNGAR